MRKLWTRLRRFCSQLDGPTAVEYAVMLALLVLVASASMQTVGCRTQFTFNRVSQKLPSR